MAEPSAAKSTKTKRKGKQENTATKESKSSRESSVSCKLCSQSFQRHYNYSTHMKKKHGILVCAQCPSTFTRSLFLKRHMNEHKTEDKDKMQTNSKNNKSSFVCESCGEALRSQKKLQKHLLAHTDTIPFVCPECGKSFRTKDSRRRHMQIHGEKYICPECGKQFSSRATLNSHKVVHSDDLNHQCDYCGRLFKRAKALKNHILAHTNIRAYECDFCGKTFTTGPCCRFHKRKMHPKELAELEASGVITYTKNIPTLKELREIAHAGKDLMPLLCKRSGPMNFSVLFGGRFPEETS